MLPTYVVYTRRAKQSEYPEPEKEKERLSQAKELIQALQKEEHDVALTKSQSVRPPKNGLMESTMTTEDDMTTKGNTRIISLILEQILQEETTIKLSTLLKPDGLLVQAFKDYMRRLKAKRIGKITAKECIMSVNKLAIQEPHIEYHVHSLRINQDIIVSMNTLEHVLQNIVIDGRVVVNIIPITTWETIGRPKLWLPTFRLGLVDQHGVQPLGMM